MEFIILFLLIINIAVAISNFSKRKIDLTIPATVIIMALIVYLLGLFDNVNIGVRIVEFIASGMAVYNIIYFINSIIKKNFKEDVKRIITPRIISLL